MRQPFKKQSFLKLFTLLSMAIILLLVYQNCGSLGSHGSNIFTSNCGGAFSNCATGDINSLAITSSNVTNPLVVPVNTAINFAANINITGNCNTGGFSNVVVRGTIVDSSGGLPQECTIAGSSCTFSSTCNPTTGAYSLQGYANLQSTGKKYYMNLEIVALNQYLQETRGPHSLYSNPQLTVTTTVPPVLSVTGCSSGQTLQQCLQNSSNVWKIPTNGSSLASTATVITSGSSSITFNGTGPSNPPLTGFCIPGLSAPVNIYIVPYGANYAKFQPIASVTCNTATSGVPSPTSGQAYGTFSYSTQAAALTWDNETIWCAPNDTTCTSNTFNKSSSRLAQIVVTQTIPVSGVATTLATSRNVFFRFTSPLFGNSWDVNLLQETIRRVARAFSFGSTPQTNLDVSGYSASANQIYSRPQYLAGAQPAFASCPLSYDIQDKDCGCSAGTCSCAAFPINSAYYVGVRTWLVSYSGILGASEFLQDSATTTPAVTQCPSTPGTQSSGHANFVLTGPDNMGYQAMASAATCGLINGESPASGLGDVEAQRIAACLTSRYMMGIWNANSAYANKFTTEGVTCSNGSCSSCTFQSGDTSFTNLGSPYPNACVLLGNFYNEAWKLKQSYLASGIATASSTSANYKNFYGAMTQYYINTIMHDLSGMGKAGNNPLYLSVFSSAYPNITDTSVINVMNPIEVNYGFSGTSTSTNTVVPFGMAFDFSPGGPVDNNFPQGAY